MSETCPTIKVVNPADEDGGYMIINECDFDESEHDLFVESDGSVEKALTKPEIIEKLEALGVEFKSSAKKGELLALLEESEAE